MIADCIACGSPFCEDCADVLCECGAGRCRECADKRAERCPDCGDDTTARREDGIIRELTVVSPLIPGGTA